MTKEWIETAFKLKDELQKEIDKLDLVEHSKLKVKAAQLCWYIE